jgi:subtilisin family serine protease
MMHPTRSLRNRLSRAWLVVLAGLAFLAWCSWDSSPAGWKAPAASCPTVFLAHEQAADGVPMAGEPFPLRERSRLLAALGVDRWHAEGFRGRGVKVAVLDSGFRGFRSHLGAALPARVTWKSFRADGNLEAKDSQHGILCGEVLHVLAPEAELLLANWEPDRPDQFLAAVRWARAQGARVISCSVIMPSWSDGEGGGPVNQALAQVLGTGDRATDALCFASAGNTAERHWSGVFHAGRGGLHEWQPGQTGNRLTPWGTDQVSVELYGPSASRFDLRVRDTATGKEVGRSTSGREADRGWNVVRFQPKANASYWVQVGLKRGQPGPFHLVVLGGGLAYATPNGSIPFPADNPDVVAVGAVLTDGTRATYSSCGPNSRQLKPDLVAPVPFPSSWRPRPFAGTSAAAPQAAALAALCWSRHPDWTPTMVRQALRGAAHDLGPPGHDWETGYGQIALPTEKSAPPAHIASAP